MPSTTKSFEKRPASSSLQFLQRFLYGSGGLILGLQRQSPMEGFFAFLSRFEAVIFHSEMAKQVGIVRPFLGALFQKLDGLRMVSTPIGDLSQNDKAQSPLPWS